MRKFYFALISSLLSFSFLSISAQAKETCEHAGLRLDHVIWAVPDLEKGAADFEAMTGVKPMFGGVHTGGATANYLVSLGDCLYLEIIGPNPEGIDNEQSVFFKNLKAPSMYGYAMRSNDMVFLKRKAEKAGFIVAGPRDGGRARPDGVMLNWQSMAFSGKPGTDYLPFVINWLDSPHPSFSTPRGITLKSFVLHNEKAEEISVLTHDLGMPIMVEGGKMNLALVLNTPKGGVKLNVTF
jgi:hypothetical protein